MGYEGIEELAAQGFFVDVLAESLDIAAVGGADDLGDGIIRRFHIYVVVGGDCGDEAAHEDDQGQEDAAIP